MDGRGPGERQRICRQCFGECLHTGRVLKAQIPYPCEMPEKGSAVEDGWIFILSAGCAWRWDVTIGVAIVCFIQGRGRVDAQATLGIPVAVHKVQQAQMQAVDEAPQETGKEDVIA